MFGSREHKIATSCGVTAYDTMITKLSMYTDCDTLHEINCQSDHNLNNILNSEIDGFFIVDFYGTLTVKLINNNHDIVTPISGHMIIIEKNQDKYTIHQSFLYSYLHKSVKVNKQEIIEFMKKLKYINDRRHHLYNNDENMKKIIGSLFGIYCLNIVNNDGITINFVTPTFEQNLLQNKILKFKTIPKLKFLETVSMNFILLIKSYT